MILYSLNTWTKLHKKAHFDKESQSTDQWNISSQSQHKQVTMNTETENMQTAWYPRKAGEWLGRD